MDPVLLWYQSYGQQQVGNDVPSPYLASTLCNIENQHPSMIDKQDMSDSSISNTCKK